MKWWEGTYLAFDTETTSPDPEEARIVTAALAEVDADGTVHDAWNVLINPGVPIPQGASDVHGITNDVAATGADPMDGITSIVKGLHLALNHQTPIVAFNARFDFTVLDRECRRHRIHTLDYRTGGVTMPVLDPYVMDKHVDTYRRGSRKLGDMCKLYGVPLTNAHDAEADAVAAANLARALIWHYKGLQLPPDVLHKAQRIWAKQQAASLERYLRVKHNDPTLTCEREWPTVPFTAPIPATTTTRAAK